MFNKTVLGISLGLGLLSGLAGCTAQQATSVAQAEQNLVVDGQLFCAKATAYGPLVVALADAAGAPVVVTGAASSVVAAECAAIGAIPVTPPANPATAPVVAAPVAASAKT